MSEKTVICPWCDKNIEEVVDGDGRELWEWHGEAEFDVDCPACGRPFHVEQDFVFEASKLDKEETS